MAILEVEHINKTFGRTEVLDRFLGKWKDDTSALPEFFGDTG